MGKLESGSSAFGSRLGASERAQKEMELKLTKGLGGGSLAEFVCLLVCLLASALSRVTIFDSIASRKHKLRVLNCVVLCCWLARVREGGQAPFGRASGEAREAPESSRWP